MQSITPAATTVHTLRTRLRRAQDVALAAAVGATLAGGGYAWVSRAVWRTAGDTEVALRNTAQSASRPVMVREAPIASKVRTPPTAAELERARLMCIRARYSPDAQPLSMERYVRDAAVSYWNAAIDTVVEWAGEASWSGLQTQVSQGWRAVRQRWQSMSSR
ncbi:hypothetical protein CDCA_CDCA01G0355 [Cyanidium caldarium]|uniref:Uncharacterized protein n=1 Tax=Cyanidium caldarium TaxID=2771 RepID=A0AAV9IQH4_CYACA|nr:hypothetical protein CDCA_CDCA01G0355 [Cyanidium caldarium]